MTTAAGAIRPRLRPLSLSELLDTAIRLYFANLGTLVKAALVVVVPVQVVSTVLTADYTLSSLDTETGAATTPREALDEVDRYLGSLATSALLHLCAVLLVTAACLRAIATAYLGQPVGWRASLSFARERGTAVLELALLYILGVGAGTLLFAVPGIWLYVAWAAAMPLLLIEGGRGAAALRRSFWLVGGRWWRTFGAVLVGFVLGTIISTVAQGIFVVAIALGEGSDAVVLVLSALAGICGLAFGAPLQAVLLTLVYLDLRVRREGLELDRLARELGVAPPELDDPSESPAPEAAVTLARPDEPSAPGPPPPPPGWRASAGDGAAGAAMRTDHGVHHPRPPAGPPGRPGG